MLRRIHGDKVAGSKLLIEARGPMFRRLRELFQSRETLPPRQAYRPILTPLGDGRVEQTFSATHIQVELRPDLAQLALSEASPHGTSWPDPHGGAERAERVWRGARIQPARLRLGTGPLEEVELDIHGAGAGNRRRS
jgi:hypothetical protein